MARNGPARRPLLFTLPSCTIEKASQCDEIVIGIKLFAHVLSAVIAVQNDHHRPFNPLHVLPDLGHNGLVYRIAGAPLDPDMIQIMKLSDPGFPRWIGSFTGTVTRFTA